MKVTNISGGQLVCTLADGSTLRLKNKESGTYKDEVATKYLRNLVKKGKVIISYSKPVGSNKKAAVKSDKEVSNGNV